MTQQSRSVRRSTGRLAVVLVGAVLASISLPPASARAGAGVLYQVDTLADIVAADSHCSLREAIVSSNGFTSECGPASGGSDGISIAVNGTIVLGSALPAINGDLGIDGAGTVAISGNNAFDNLTVNAGKTLVLARLALANGLAARTNKGTAHVSRVVFANDASVGQLPALTNADGGVLTVEKSVFTNNGGSDLRYGGALRNAGEATITSSTFKGNRAANGVKGVGGAIANFGTMAVNKSTFARNVATDRGGAIFSEGGSATISNSMFFRNNAFTGGAVFAGNASGPVTVVSSTFAGNTATEGTAIGASSPGTTVTLRNSIMSGAAAGTTCFTSDSGTITDGGNNVSWPDATCPGLHMDPKLDTTLRDNGGQTKTVALRWNSPAIDRGDPTTCSVAPVSNRDQRGGLRPIDGNHNGAPRCDMGAFEFGGLAPGAPRLRSATRSGGDEILTWRHARDALRYIPDSEERLARGDAEHHDARHGHRSPRGRLLHLDGPGMQHAWMYPELDRLVQPVARRGR